MDPFFTTLQSCHSPELGWHQIPIHIYSHQVNKDTLRKRPKSVSWVKEAYRSSHGLVFVSFFVCLYVCLCDIGIKRRRLSVHPHQQCQPFQPHAEQIHAKFWANPCEPCDTSPGKARGSAACCPQRSARTRPCPVAAAAAPAAAVPPPPLQPCPLGRCTWPLSPWGRWSWSAAGGLLRGVEGAVAEAPACAWQLNGFKPAIGICKRPTHTALEW